MSRTTRSICIALLPAVVLAGEPAARKPLKVGDPAPTIGAVTMDGNAFDRRHLTGRALVLVFWKAAQVEAPEGRAWFDAMKRVRREQAGRDDVALLSVCIDAVEGEAASKAWSDFVLKQGTVDFGDGPRRFIDDSRWWSMMQMGPEPTTADCYRVRTPPEAFIIGPDDRLLAVRVGRSRLAETVAKVLAPMRATKADRPSGR